MADSLPQERLNQDLGLGGKLSERSRAMPAPRICCLDLDTFFVSVERILDPSLEGKQVVVGGRPGTRGVVTACSYEVREVGVRSGMSLTEAGRLAPDAVYLPVRGGAYSEYAEKVRKIASRYSPVVQVASIDELYMDFAGCERLYRKSGDASDNATIERAVREMTAVIQDELGLPSSAGIGASRAMAKIASGLAKPAGVLLVPAGNEAALLAPLPVRKLPGIGPVAEEKLQRAGLATLGQVAAMPVSELRRIFGAWAEHVKDGARGLGSADLSRDRAAFREHDVEGDSVGSISNERTFRCGRRRLRDHRVAVVLALRTGLLAGTAAWCEGAHGDPEAALLQLPDPHSVAHNLADVLGSGGLPGGQGPLPRSATWATSSASPRRRPLEPRPLRWSDPAVRGRSAA